MKYAFTTTIGVDVSKHTLDIFCHADSNNSQFSNSPEGIAELIQWIRKRAEQCLVIIEPTGGYERMLQQMVLTTNGMQLAKINARQIREFARAKGRFAKTDRIDARLLAEYGIAMNPRVAILPPAYRQELSALIMRRQQLTNSISRERTRLPQAGYEFAKQSIQDVIAFLHSQVLSIDAAMRELIKINIQLKEAYKVINGVAGVGPLIAAVLLAELPELGRIDNKAISSLVGVAPHNVDSGNMRGERHIHGGRPYVRKMLYMAVLSTIRYHDTIRTFYQNLILRGKKPKVALVAAMRKLIIILNAKMRDYYAQSA